MRYFAQFLLLIALFLLVSASAPSINYYLAHIDGTSHTLHGHQVVRGNFPFIDIFSAAGPLSTLVPAVGFLFSSTLVPQTLMSAFGYALSLFLIALLVFRLADVQSYGKAILSVLITLCAYIMLAKFYKWYFWLFPLLVLTGGLHFFRTGRVKWIVFMGVASGVAWLYRIDLAVACMAATIATCLAVAVSTKAYGDVKAQAPMLIGGFVLPIGVWLIVLGILGGFANIELYVVAYFDAVGGILTHMILPYPQFTLAFPLSEQSCHFLTLALVPLAYMVGLFVAWNGMRKPVDSESWRYPMLAFVALMGIALFPQALHRKSVPHLLQVIPPFLIVVSILAPMIWRTGLLSSRKNRNWIYASRFALCCFLALIVSSGIGVNRYFAIEYESPADSPVSRYINLAEGASAGRSQYDVAEMARKIQKLSGPDESILILPRKATYFYYWADRRMSGMTMAYNGFYSQPRWQERILRSVTNDPPSLLIVDESFFTLSEENVFRTYYPELYEFASTTYTKKASTIGPFTIMLPEYHAATEE